ncbi:MAG: hydrogenase iron-sulfur subunit, partial [Thermodesulfobacteriota bacterium]
LNPYLLEFVSIREQVSWVHMADREAATAKAKDLVRMGVAKAVLLEEGEEIRLPVGRDCLIVGGGLAGLTAALAVADQGFQAVLVEKEPRLGGLLNRVAVVSHEHGKKPAAEIVGEKIARVEAHPNIRVFTDTVIKDVAGYIGNYKVKLGRNGDGSEETLDISTIVVATGMREIEPVGQFGYGTDPRVVTGLQLEQRLRDRKVGEARNVVFINCVGSRDETRGCCNVGCHVSVKNALALRQLDPERKVHVLYRDLSLVREEHFQLDAAKAAGVKFIRFPDDRYPTVEPDGDGLRVTVRDVLLGRELSVPADLLVLTTAFQGGETVDQIKGQLKVSANPDGFFQEAHIKLRPVDFAADGLALAGCAKSPKFTKETLEEGAAAAMRISIPMNRGYIEAEGIVADIDLTDCDRCGLCGKRCPYGAILLAEDKTPSVIKALCKGCGLCAADCPTESISIVHYTDEQIMAQVEAALEKDPEKKIVGFVCHWCALGGVDMAGVSRLQYPTPARLIRVMCSARVSIKMVERAFELGAAGVLVAGCEFPTCHYISGNYACEARMKRAKKKLTKKGHDPEKLWNIWCSAADGPKFANTMREMARALGLE